MPEVTPEDLRDLSALADGTLDPARRATVEAHIAASAELGALYARERQIVAVLEQARSTDRAPASLRARIEAERPRPAAPRRRIGYAGGLAAGLTAAVVAVVLVLSGGAAGPAFSAAASLGVRGPAAAAPQPEPGRPGALAASIDTVYFPNWATRYGWQAEGTRVDRINGRRAVTVFYSGNGHRIAYTIVDEPALTAQNAAVTNLNCVELRTLMLGGRTVVTWQRENHTCVLSSTTVPASELQRLAADDNAIA